MGTGKGWINGLRFAGQQHEVTYELEAAVEVDDAVGATATAGLLGRGTDGDEIVGVVLTKESDGHGAVLLRGSNKVVTVARDGAIAVGVQALAVNGAGAVTAGTGTTEFVVIGTQTIDSVDTVTFVL